jgi:hypothetical protein
MKNQFLCLFALVSLSSAAPLCGQDKLPPLPPGPLLKRAPDYSTWTVTIQGRPEEGNEPSKTGATPEGRPTDKEPVTMLSTVVKTGSTILEQNVQADGRRHQIWHVSGIRIVSGSSNPMISQDYGGGDIFSTNFASSDFAGFDWVAAGTYSGMAKYQGNDCLVFKGTVSPLSAKAQLDEQAFIEGARALGQSVPDALRVPAIACIDLETRLPLYAQFGQEKRIYRYGAPPTMPLALPPELTNFLKEYAQRIERLSAPVPRAY